MPTITPNMGMPVSTVAVDTGTAWETNLNASLSILDGHDHSPGKGVPVTPAGLDINTDLSLNGNSATLVKSVVFAPQASLGTIGSLGVIGPDLYYEDGAGNVIQMTASGALNVTSSGISSGTATASFVAGVLVVNAAALTPANIQVASVLLGNNTPSSNYLTLSPPSAMGSSYGITLPSLPVAANTFLTMDTAGNITATNTIDGVTIVRNAGVLSVPINIAGNYSQHQFEANGPYSTATFPQNAVDGLMFFNANAMIIAVWIYSLTAGSAGTTEFDLLLASPGGSFSSILSTTGKIDSTASSNIWTDSNSVVGVQTGVTKPILSSANVSAGQALRFDILQTMTGAADCGVIVQYVAR